MNSISKQPSKQKTKEEKEIGMYKNLLNKYLKNANVNENGQCIKSNKNEDRLAAISGLIQKRPTQKPTKKTTKQADEDKSESEELKEGDFSTPNEALKVAPFTKKKTQHIKLMKQESCKGDSKNFKNGLNQPSSSKFLSKINENENVKINANFIKISYQNIHTFFNERSSSENDNIESGVISKKNTNKTQSALNQEKKSSRNSGGCTNESVKEIHLPVLDVEHSSYDLFKKKSILLSKIDYSIVLTEMRVFASDVQTRILKIEGVSYRTDMSLTILCYPNDKTSFSNALFVIKLFMKFENGLSANFFDSLSIQTNKNESSPVKRNKIFMHYSRQIQSNVIQSKLEGMAIDKIQNFTDFIDTFCKVLPNTHLIQVNPFSVKTKKINSKILGWVEIKEGLINQFELLKTQLNIFQSHQKIFSYKQDYSYVVEEQDFVSLKREQTINRKNRIYIKDQNEFFSIRNFIGVFLVSKHYSFVYVTVSIDLKQLIVNKKYSLKIKVTDTETYNETKDSNITENDLGVNLREFENELNSFIVYKKVSFRFFQILEHRINEKLSIPHEEFKNKFFTPKICRIHVENPAKKDLLHFHNQSFHFVFATCVFNVTFRSIKSKNIIIVLKVE